MTARTKGPWSVVENGGRMVGVMSGSEWVTYKAGQDRMTTEELEANANLIAAAPDLLEACEAHIAALRSQIRDGKYRPEYAEAIYQAQKKMEAAIAKAKGE